MSKNKGLSLDNFILKINRFYFQYVAAFTSGGALIAVSLSAFAIGAGLVSAGYAAHYSTPFLAVFGLVGTLLAILVETSTIMACNRARAVWARRKELEAEIEAKKEKRNADIDALDKRLKSKRNAGKLMVLVSIGSILVTSALSMIVGHLFWSMLFKDVVSPYNEVLSVALAFVPSFVMVFFQLGETMNIEDVASALSVNKVETAIRTESVKRRAIAEYDEHVHSEADEAAKSEQFKIAARIHYENILDEVVGGGSGSLKKQLENERLGVKVTEVPNEQKMLPMPNPYKDNPKAVVVWKLLKKHDSEYLIERKADFAQRNGMDKRTFVSWVEKLTEAMQESI
ncbi:hypothetical protein [Ktedonospora formicarum]|uniref:Uncharacterized protein n=1 Tax=Ktedonospora formicarum TaxID=2778364 RepID=A0A8J3MSF4_9CHLR|nr:hypothetical protein [Ktedonospora formicarum]GHO44563.1 hypothetical protein KSX_27260 [Ktedonospora formicarum]